jgi:hypothetical protein
MRSDAVPPGGSMPDIVSKVPRLDSLNIPPRCELIVLEVDGRQRLVSNYCDCTDSWKAIF